MENKIPLNEEQKELVEKVGVMHEKGGMQPAPARVLALLLVSPDTELSFDRIRETLNLSKSASSNALNMLLSTGKIDYITKPGDRKRYFRNRVAFWKEEIKKDFGKFAQAADLLEEVLQQRPGNTTQFNNSLSEVIDFMRFLIEQIPDLYRKWEAKNK